MLTIISSFYNEEAGVEKYLEGLRICLLHNSNVQAILINNGSIDNTLTKLISINSNSTNIRIVDNLNPKGYGSGVKLGIKESKTPYILILPSDLQFNFTDVDRLINYTKNLSNDFKLLHLNVFTKRKRLDGHFSSIRGRFWAFLVFIQIKIPLKFDPASQLRVLCRCCIPETISNDFMWDLEIAYRIVKSRNPPTIIGVDFESRKTGKSSVSKLPIKSELSAAIKLFKLSRILRN